MSNIYKTNYHKNYSQDLIARKHLLDFVSKKLKFKGLTGLDAGCNGGFLSFFLVSAGAKKIYGIDMSPGFIKRNIKNAKIWKLDKKLDFKVGNIEKLPYKDDFFDYIICSEVLEHVENPEKVISEFERVLKSNGTILLTTPNILNPGELMHNAKHYLMWLLKGEEFTHIQHFTFMNLKKLFKNFKKVSMEGVGFGAAFLPFSSFSFLKRLDYELGKTFQPISFDIFVTAKKKGRK